MSPQFSKAAICEAVDFITQGSSLRPRVGMILGSGLAALASEVVSPTVIPYAKVPHFAPCTVEGHPGELILGHLQGCPVILMRGRLHFYEGYSIQQVVFPVRVMWGLGVKYLVVTNAAGGLNTAFRAGDLMLITDHIGLSNMVGLNPLHGPNDPEIGPRFPDMSHVYDVELRALTLQAAADNGIPIHQGVYVMSSGPSFETPADLRFLRLIGADAVGMSTVPEATAAHHAGIRVLGISGITNEALLQPSTEKTTHAEVLEAGKRLAAKLAPLIREVLQRLEPNAGPSASPFRNC